MQPVKSWILDGLGPGLCRSTTTPQFPSHSIAWIHSQDVASLFISVCIQYSLKVNTHRSDGMTTSRHWELIIQSIDGLLAGDCCDNSLCGSFWKRGGFQVEECEMSVSFSRRGLTWLTCTTCSLFPFLKYVMIITLSFVCELLLLSIVVTWLFLCVFLRLSVQDNTPWCYFNMEEVEILAQWIRDYYVYMGMSHVMWAVIDQTDKYWYVMEIGESMNLISKYAVAVLMDGSHGRLICHYWLLQKSWKLAIAIP